MADVTVEDNYSLLSSADEKSWALCMYFMLPIAFIIAIQIIVVLSKHLKSSKKNKENVYYIWAIRCAIISEICTVCTTLTDIFVGNDLFIDWNYDEYSTIIDALIEGLYFIGKITFYFGFTFHIQSILNKPMPFLLKLWMFINAIIVAIHYMIFKNL